MRGQRRLASRRPPFFDQVFTDSKGKEVGATQNLIDKMPDMPGCVMTFDALHAVKKTFEGVIDKRADFLVCVKDNAADLRRRLDKYLNRRRKDALRAETVEKAHGRFERRSLEMVSLFPWRTGWPHTHMACRVERERRLIRRGETVGESFEHVIYVGSFAVDKYSPARVLALTRGHWGIENGLHHRKDRSMDEDRCRAAAAKTGRVMCCLRSIAALVFDRAGETMNVVRRRFSKKTHLVLGLLSCASLNEWERKFKPYKLKPTT